MHRAITGLGSRAVARTCTGRAPLPLAGSLCVFALAAMLVPGCATDQRRDIGLYRAIADPPGAETAPATAPGSGRDTVNNAEAAASSMSLIDALRHTAMLNERLAIRGEEYVQALAERQRAAAALLPTIDLFSTAAVRENTASAGVVQSSFGGTGQYRLLTGLSDLRTVDAGDATSEARRWLILDLRESLLLETAAAYYESLRAERLVRVLESSAAVQEERLRDARVRNEVGFARPLDVAQNEAQVSRTRTQLIAAQRQVREARATLSLLTGVPAAGVMLSDGYEIPAEERDLPALVALAELHRQDLLAARSDAHAARSLVDAAIGRFAPTISLNLDYFIARGPDDTAAAVASLIELRVPVFSAGRIEAEVRSAWSVFRQRVLEYRLRVREASRDVEIALIRLRSSVERARELRTQVRAARDALTLAEASYRAGLGTNLELVTAQDQLLTAELEAASEEFTTKAAMLALRRACGLLSVDMLQSPLPEATPGEPPDSPLLDRVAGRPAAAATSPEQP